MPMPSAPMPHADVEIQLAKEYGLTPEQARKYVETYYN